MANFKFKLQKLLDIKIKEEEESKIEYTRIQNEKKTLENNLRSLEMDYKKYADINSVKDRVKQTITLNYLSALVESISSTNVKLKEAELNVSKAKDDFIQKQIKRKSLETLKENEISKLQREEARIEQINNDEFALYGYIRNKANVS